MVHEWWKEAIIYQIYPRSFKDSNGDGIGDLPGILEKLDYLASLGVDLIWLNPVYSSPNDDNGYDISNYEDIMLEFGTMADFDVLLQGLHQRGMKLLMDLVVNHTSDEHPWFVASRSSRDNPYRDFYHWWPAEKGTPPPRFSFFDPNADAWAFDEHTQAWYLHYFSRKQPDLNWENPTVREAVYNMMRFWFDKGVDGFRMDVISFISKETPLAPIPPEELAAKYYNDWSYYYSHGPRLHEYLKEMHQRALKDYNIVTMAEAPGIRAEEALLFVHSDREELHMLYHFEGMNLGYTATGFKRPDPSGYALTAFKQVYSKWDGVFAKAGWGTIYLGNHDQPRMTSRWGNDAPEYRQVSAKMLITFLLSMRATPIFYAGDELGMTNIRFNTIDDYRDIETHMMYRYLQNRHEDVAAFLEDMKTSARDNGRTPFQWDHTPHAGFTTGTPWLKVNENFPLLNQADQEKDPASVLQFFRILLRLRKSQPALIYGDYTLLDPDHAQVYAYTRILNQDGFLVVMNFSKQQVVYELPLAVKEQPLINNYPAMLRVEKTLTLQPYQALIFSVPGRSGKLVV
ncbi:oligo-1,6-glucosidase [Chitinophaga costaii]|uniref:Oligo-1,6-glucosidase n=1 Tax=Chitinophaga costaii TaxID=1335309 RepID=A0A1C4FFD0_9BACT|nr:alpha-glucosidase [Chitinophaga costaii]PUZ20116.1 alpha-glucosidase [Chitinophaga costaii]SCC54554.1 oligo-1,6-glucosidase [Chitinophaga costaii]